LTVRHGSKVDHERFDDLSGAIEALDRRAEAIRREGRAEPVSGFRDYEPSEQVTARLEVSAGGLLRRRDAGLDVMGDGAVVPYAGAIRRRRLEPRDGQSPLEAIREALA
jgi:hypothetical protein